MNTKILLLAVGITFLQNALSQNVGIGTTTPNAPLQFSNSTGNRKLVLFEHVNDDHQFYGFGVNGGVLRYQTATLNDDHVFYSGNSNNTSRELMRIKGNGNVGIGTNAPAFRLDVDNRMRIRSGGDITSTAGLWLNSTNNTSLQAFIGINTTNTVGFFGGHGGDWGLLMNTQNGNVGIGGANNSAAKLMSQSIGGAQLLLQNNSGSDYARLQMRNANSATTSRFWDIAGIIDANSQNNDRLNFFSLGRGDVLSLSGSGAVGFLGNFGQPGQVLTSNGINSAPVWTNPPGYPSFTQQSAEVNITNQTVDIPGAEMSFNLPAAARVLITYVSTIVPIQCFGCGDKWAQISLFYNNVFFASANTFVPNNAGNFTASISSGPVILDLPAGTHSFKLRAAGNNTITATIIRTRLAWQIFPN